MRTHVRLEALGTYLFLAVRRPLALPAVVRLAGQVVRDVDATCSRFRADSDLSRANRSPGTWVDVDPLLVAAVDVACEAAAQTDGMVHPLLGRSLVQLGYDRDFRLLRIVPPVPGSRSDAAPNPPGIHSWRGIDRNSGGAIRLPSGTALDLGSVGKAWAADLVAAAIEMETEEAALVDLGGDVRIAAPDGEAWEVAVSERPEGPVQELVALRSGGLATSSTRIRRWSHRGVDRHHVLDPRTGRSAAEVWRTVTATGPSCVAANTASTAAVVLGEQAPRWLDDRRVAARLVPPTGAVVTTRGWPAATNPVDPPRRAS